MRQFFKFVFASCLGVILAFGAIILILLVIGLSSSDTVTTKKNSFLRLTFDHSVSELTDNIQFSFSNTTRAIGIHDISRLIKEAKTDDKIAGIVINAPQVSMGPSTANLLREALLDFKKGDKPIYAYGDFYGQMGYYLSSAADSVFMNPNGSIEIMGFGAVIPFYKNLMDKVGVKMNIFYRGRYKGATEPYRRNNMSDDNRLQYKEYLDHLQKNYFEEIAASRNVTYEDINFIADNTLVVTPDECLRYNLIDSVIYEADFEQFLKEKTGVKKSRLTRFTDLEDYLTANPYKESKGDNQIALVYAEGNVVYNSDENGAISERKYSKIFERIIKNDKIKAVVLRVNSPGGSSISSDILWDQVGKLKESGKYVAVSMGDYAASGGYYIACNADTIFADKNTLTGSIGVYLMYPEISKLVQDKLEIGIDSVVTNKYTATNSFFLALNPDESTKMENYTDYLYKQFLSRVATSRDMTVESVHEIAEGRIWTSSAALSNNLIDEIGTLDQTITSVANRLDIENYSIINYPKIEKDFTSELFKTFAQKVKIPKVNNQVEAKILEHMLQQFNMFEGYKQPKAQMEQIFWY